MMATEPELTQVPVDEPGREMIRRFVDYVTANGCDVASMAVRMERLKFETIVREQSYGEVLASLDGGTP
jgi:hypothetical protein